MENNNRFVAREHSSRSGSLIGYVTCSFCELCEVFGQPNAETDEYKVSTEWECKDITTGDLFTLYDWKETNLYDDPSAPSVEEFRMLPEYEWHIGGPRSIDFAGLSQFMSEKLGRKIEARPDRIYNPTLNRSQLV